MSSTRHPLVARWKGKSSNCNWKFGVVEVEKWFQLYFAKLAPELGAETRSRHDGP
jgi:hypothetical protein